MSDGRMTFDELKSWLQEYARLIADNRAELCELDAAIGDGDHGTNMSRGMDAVIGSLSGESIGDIAKQAGMTLVSTVGGASGPLYGTFFLRCGTALTDVSDIDAPAFGAALRAGVEGVIGRGKAELEDKTMVDAWLPALDAYDQAVEGGASIADALRAAADAAAEGRDATIPLIARKGRASYLGERSRDHQDPGATSTTLLLEAAASTLA